MVLYLLDIVLLLQVLFVSFLCVLVMMLTWWGCINVCFHDFLDQNALLSSDVGFVLYSPPSSRTIYSSLYHIPRLFLLYFHFYLGYCYLFLNPSYLIPLHLLPTVNLAYFPPLSLDKPQIKVTAPSTRLSFPFLVNTLSQYTYVSSRRQ